MKKTDIEILEEIKGGNYSHIYDDLYDVCWSIGGRRGLLDKANMDDIFQNAVIGLHSNITKKDGFELTCKFSTYFIQLFMNNLYKFFNKKKVNFIAEDFIIEDETDDKVHDDMVSDIIDNILDTLSENQRHIITQSYFYKVNYADIANELGFSNSNSIKTQKYKIIQKLKPIFKREFKLNDLVY